MVDRRTIHPRRFLRAAYVVVLFSTLGCANATRPNPFGGGIDQTSEVEILVRNEGFDNQDIYAFWENGPRQWLGIVPPATTRSFTLRYRGTGIRFSGGPRVFVPVYPGDRLELVFPEAGEVFPPRRVRPS